MRKLELLVECFVYLGLAALLLVAVGVLWTNIDGILTELALHLSRFLEHVLG